MNAERELLPDRRSALRQPIQAISVIVRDDTNAQYQGELLEVSRSGVRCALAADLPIGAQVVIEPPDGTELRPARGIIIRRIDASPGRPATPVYGIRFADEAEVRRHTWWLTLRKAA